MSESNNRTEQHHGMCPAARGFGECRCASEREAEMRSSKQECTIPQHMLRDAHHGCLSCEIERLGTQVAARDRTIALLRAPSETPAVDQQTCAHEWTDVAHCLVCDLTYDMFEGDADEPTAMHPHIWHHDGTSWRCSWKDCNATTDNPYCNGDVIVQPPEKTAAVQCEFPGCHGEHPTSVHDVCLRSDYEERMAMPTEKTAAIPASDQRNQRMFELREIADDLKNAVR